MTENTALTFKCFELCQPLVNQEQAFNFSLTLGNSFILDTRIKEPTLEARKKQTSPSSLRRNKIRRQKFLETRNISATSAEHLTATNESEENQTNLEVHIKDNTHLSWVFEFQTQ